MSCNDRQRAALNALAEQAIRDYDAGDNDHAELVWQKMTTLPGFKEWDAEGKERLQRSIEMYGIPNGICTPFRGGGK